MKVVILSKYDGINLYKYYCNIYRFIYTLRYSYAGFNQWYKNLWDIHNGVYLLKVNREIIVVEYLGRIVGVCILKNDMVEKKICTLKVDRYFRGQGIGKLLIELAFNILETERPLITISGNRKDLFKSIIKRYNFELVDVGRYYDKNKNEYIYNKSLKG